MRVPIAIALVLLALASGALAAPPKEAHFTLDGVGYQYIMGVNRTETAVLEPAGDASAQLPIESCAFVILHAGTPNGRVVIYSIQSGVVPVTMYIDQMRLPNGTRGYAYDSPVTEDGQARVADLAVTGNGTLRVAAERYYDPTSSSGDEDLDKEDPDMVGTLSLVSEGVRDDVTGAVLSGKAVEDAELHVHLRSNSESSPASIVTNYASSGIAPPTEAFGVVERFSNLKFGGEATLDISTNAYAAPGMNRLTFAVLSPLGDLVANVTLEPALLAEDTATLSFPLDLFGDYTILVNGEVALAEYSMILTQSPPPNFDLHLWWENVTYGYQAYQDYKACMDLLGSPNAIIATDSVVGRPNPPQLNVALVVMGVAGGVAAVTVAVKLASDQVSLAAFRKGK